MIPDLTRLAKHACLDAEAVRRDAAAHLAALPEPRRPVLSAILEIADRTVNTDALAPAVIPALMAVAREVEAESTSAGGTVGTRLRRVLSAHTLHSLRELGLYRDSDGVEPVWPHAGMLILNPILGCSFGCVYCFRADEQRESVDWFLNGKPTKVISEETVVDRLARHPLFVPGVTQLGLHTATTEPFLPTVRESTFRILELLEERGWRNDVMIITKHFISEADVARLASFTSFQILLFLTHSAAPVEMEALGARPGFTRRKRETVEYLLAQPRLAAAHYYRPIVPGWNDSEEQIAEALTFGEPLGVTVVGGLKEIPNLPEISQRRGLRVPVVATGDEHKHFPPELVDRILAVHQRLGLTSTIVGDQSCGLTVLLSRLRGSAVPNVEAVRMYDAATGRRPKCMGRCPAEQLAACERPPAPDDRTVRSLLAGTGVDFTIAEDGVYLHSATVPGKSTIESLAAHLRYAVFWRPAR
jgi:hypothetical protein